MKIQRRKKGEKESSPVQRSNKSKLLPYYCQPRAKTTANLLRTTTRNLLRTQQWTLLVLAPVPFFSKETRRQLGKQVVLEHYMHCPCPALGRWHLGLFFCCSKKRSKPGKWLLPQHAPTAWTWWNLRVNKPTLTARLTPSQCRELCHVCQNINVCYASALTKSIS